MVWHGFVLCPSLYASIYIQYFAKILTEKEKFLFIYLFFFYHFAIQAKYIHKIKIYQAREPNEANKAY